jgi:hypothetical protein
MSATSGIDTFADFDVDPTTSIVAAFDCLAIQNEWKKKSAKYKDNRVRLFTNEFGIQFGNNWSHLGGWQALCSAVGIADIPSSITQCKKVTKQKPTSYMALFDGDPAAEKDSCQHLRPHRCCSFWHSGSHVQQ